jgi:hypothetical protein
MGGSVRPFAEEKIRSVTRSLRGRCVIIDEDRAAIFGVSTGALNRAVRRNSDRFPGDFVVCDAKLTRQSGAAAGDARCLPRSRSMGPSWRLLS